jgi:hypothetical protein
MRKAKKDGKKRRVMGGDFFGENQGGLGMNPSAEPGIESLIRAEPSRSIKIE